MNLKHKPKIPAKVVSMPGIMTGDPVVRGTRIPAMTIIECLRAGESRYEIFGHYPTLPVDGIDAVEAWAKERFGPEWRTAPLPENA